MRQINKLSRFILPLVFIINSIPNGVANNILDITVQFQGKTVIEQGVILSNKIKISSSMGDINDVISKNIANKLVLSFKNHDVSLDLDSSKVIKIFIHKNQRNWNYSGLAGFFKFLRLKLFTRPGYAMTIYEGDRGRLIQLKSAKY